MGKKKKSKPEPEKPDSTVRAFRMDDDVHVKLKEIAKAENRKIGHQLMEIINRAHSAIMAKQAQ